MTYLKKSVNVDEKSLRTLLQLAGALALALPLWVAYTLTESPALALKAASLALAFASLFFLTRYLSQVSGETPSSHGVKVGDDFYSTHSEPSCLQAELPTAELFKSISIKATGLIQS